jgi:gliding motility-associated-like protein
VDDQNSNTYTFTPDAGQCALPATFAVTVNPIVTPTFSFGNSLAICAGGSVPSLPATSDNGINGTWSSSTVDNQNSGTYTFTPAAGQCATGTTFTVNVNSNTTPTFSFGSSLTICEGGSVPALPTTSDNGVAGTWNPTTVSNTATGVYTFTPNSGQCALTATFTVTVNPNITPAFSFGTSVSICDGAAAPVLPTTSNNSITGTWSPATVDNQNSGSYTFTPDGGQCALTTTLNVTVNPIVTPTFSFGTTSTICAGSTVPSLPATSDNGITGTWSPSTVDNQNSGTYTFTPANGQCANATTFTVTVTPNTIPTFSFGTSLTICAGGAVPALPNTSDNGVTGSWNPATVDNQASGVYTFTPVVAPGECIVPATFTVTVNPILTPTFSFGTTMIICSGNTAPVLPATSVNGITGTWSPAVINNQTSGTYTFTSAAGQCATPTATLTVTVNPTPTVNAIENATINDGTTVPASSFSGTPGGVNYTWTNSNTNIGLAGSGAGNVPSFEATNMGSQNSTSTITVTPVLNGCSGSSKTYTVTVIPLDKDVFVPNVFTPNSDGKNDLLLVYGNYITKLEMRIFNQWGQQIELITDKNKGWDGRYKGKAQPVGVYVYTLQAELNTGKTVKLKGHINLIR